MIRNLQKKVSTKQDYPFNPTEEQPKTAKIYLNSQDRMSGTNSEATFKVNMPCDFTSSNIGVSLINFIPNYPSGLNDGIVRVNMVGVVVRTPYTGVRKL
jgi:hypothetical protein